MRSLPQLMIQAPPRSLLCGWDAGVFGVPARGPGGGWGVCDAGRGAGVKDASDVPTSDLDEAPGVGGVAVLRRG